jgi:hypothetical protein
MVEKQLLKDWEGGFYEGAWQPDTITDMSPEEKQFVEALCRDFLPRHMEVYDWNRPYAEGILLIARRTLKENKRSFWSGWMSWSGLFRSIVMGVSLGIFLAAIGMDVTNLDFFVAALFLSLAINVSSG